MGIITSSAGRKKNTVLPLRGAGWIATNGREDSLDLPVFLMRPFHGQHMVYTNRITFNVIEKRIPRGDMESPLGVLSFQLLHITENIRVIG
jgi:hypothetical protein